MGSFVGGGNQYIQLVKVLYCKLPTNGKQLPAFQLEVRPGFEFWSQRWEASALPLRHQGPFYIFDPMTYFTVTLECVSLQKDGTGRGFEPLTWKVNKQGEVCNK